MADLGISARWERAVVPVSGGEATLLVRVVAPDRAKTSDAKGRAPVDVAFVLDRSGSMAGEKLALVKRAVQLAVRQLKDGDRAALVIYDNQVDTLCRLSAMTERGRAAVQLALRDVESGGSTNLGEGWLTGCRELSQATDNGSVRLRRSLLLTDGLANVGITDPSELTHHAEELRRRGVGTTTLGVGLDFDEVLLSGMAEAGGGNFQFIERADQLPDFFHRELGELLAVTVAGLTLSITLPAGLQIELINAYPTERRDRTLEVAVGDLAAGDAVDLVFAVSAAPGAVGTTHVLQVAAAWTDPDADARRTLAFSAAPLSLAEPSAVDAAPLDPEVAEKAARERADAERREAFRLDRAGQLAESRAHLRRAAAVLMAAPQTSGVVREMTEAQELLRYDMSAQMPEAVRKRGVWESHRRSRGKRNEPGGGGMR